MRGRRRLPPRGAGYRPKASGRTTPPKPPPGSAGVGAAMLSPIPTGPGYDPGDSSVAAPPAKPTVVVVHVQEHPLDRDVQAIQQVLATDPCRILGHRAAYLRAGGVACGICGTPL